MFYTNVEGYSDIEYTNLFNIMVHTPFKMIMNEDVRIAKMALDTRFFYTDSTGKDGVVYTYLDSTLGSPNTAEVIFRLSRIISHDIIGDGDKGDRTTDWAQRLMKNLGLLKYTDEAFYNEKNNGECSNQVSEILDIWVNREFQPNGVGSPFPLQNPPGDERQVEIWYQLHSYLKENFPS